MMMASKKTSPEMKKMLTFVAIPCYNSYRAERNCFNIMEEK